jgi:hypothetical protein
MNSGNRSGPSKRSASVVGPRWTRLEPSFEEEDVLGIHHGCLRLGDGRAAAEQVTLSFRGKRLVVDLCDQHLKELTAKARPPRRGRRPKASVAVPPKRRGRPPGSKNKRKTTTKRRATASLAKASTSRSRKKG